MGPYDAVPRFVWASASFELSVAYGVQTQITAFKVDMQEVLTD